MPLRATPRVRCIACLLILLWWPWAGRVDATHPPGVGVDGGSNQAQIRAGVYISPPFVVKDTSGNYSGMAIDLWEAAAKDLGWRYEYVERDTFGNLVDSVATGELDVAVTNLTITRERAERMDLTHPWYDAGMRVMVLDQGGGSGTLWSGLRDSGHLRTYAALGILVLVATCVLAVFDRKYNKEFPQRWNEGLAESFYQVMSVATSGKANRKNLFGPAGRVMAALWLLCGVALVAYITSSVTSVMTTVSLTRQINGIGDLPGKTIGVLAGSTAEQYARSVRFDLRPYPNIESAENALAGGDVDAVIGDAPVLEYYAHTRPGSGVVVVGDTFHKDKYGFGVHHANDMVKPLTIRLIGMHESGFVEQVRARYFGSGHPLPAQARNASHEDGT